MSGQQIISSLYWKGIVRLTACPDEFEPNVCHIYIFRNPRLALPYTFKGVLRASDVARPTVDT